MKQGFILTTFLILLATAVFASPAGKSIIKLKLTTGEPLAVKIDDRDYKKYARTLTIGDLPRGWHRIRVYRLLEYKEGGGHAKLVYSGRIKLGKGTITYCEVDPVKKRMSLSTNDIEDVYVGDGPRNGPPPEPANAPADNTIAKGTYTDADIAQLELKVQEMPTDVNTLKAMKADLSGKTCTTDQVKRIVRWLAFDDSRKDFAIWAYPSVVDKEEYASVAEEFSLDSTKEEFHLFLAKQD